MMTYLPVSLAALFCRVEWKPIRHSVNKTPRAAQARRIARRGRRTARRAAAPNAGGGRRAALTFWRKSVQ